MSDANTPLPDTKVPDTQEFFENMSQTNAANVKRTYDEYQDIALTSARRSQEHFDQLHQLSLQAMQNAIETANMVGKQAIKHADVAADALWTDELNPVTRGAGNDLTGQAPVNPALASTASLDTVFGNLTAQYGELVTQVVGLANSVMQSNAKLTAVLEKLVPASPKPAA